MARAPGSATTGWVRVTWIAFLLAVAVAGGFIALAPWLSQYGLRSSIHFIVLFPLGLAAAGFLFGAMRSSASLAGKSFGGTLQLGGPVVVFVLVMAGGLYYAHPESTFELVVRVHGPGGPNGLLKEGTVTLDLGMDRRGPVTINDRGEVNFNEIPSLFIGRKVTVFAAVPGYVLQDPSPQTLPENHVLYLPMVPAPVAPTKIGGFVRDGDANGISGVQVRLPSLSVGTTTDELGHFELALTDPGKSVRLQAEKKGYLAADQYVTAGNTDLGVLLRKSRR